MRITPRSSCLLYIVFKRIRDIIMYYQTYIFLIDSHTKSRCSHNHTHPIIHERILIGYFFIRIHLAIKRQSNKSITRQLCSQFFCALGTRYIHY